MVRAEVRLTWPSFETAAFRGLQDEDKSVKAAE